jgi:hypothetical protein
MGEVLGLAMLIRTKLVVTMPSPFIPCFHRCEHRSLDERYELPEH